MRPFLTRNPWSSANGRGVFGSVAASATVSSVARSSWRLADRLGSRPWPAPRVDVAVTCEWAGRAVARALREAGALPLPVPAPLVPEPGTPLSAALVYDLSPWDRTAVFTLQRYSAVGRTPLLLYLPPTSSAFAALSDVGGAGGSVQFQIQSRDAESLEHLNRAARALVAGIPRVRIMSLLARSVPGMSNAAFLFGHRALTMLAARQRPCAGAIARALGFSLRTLQRRFAAEGLPSPKAFLDCLTLAHLHAAAECHEVSLARAAAGANLSGNDLYRLRKRVGRLRGRWGSRFSYCRGALDGRVAPSPGPRNGGHRVTHRSELYTAV